MIHFMPIHFDMNFRLFNPPSDRGARKRWRLMRTGWFWLTSGLLAHQDGLHCPMDAVIMKVSPALTGDILEVGHSL